MYHAKCANNRNGCSLGYTINDRNRFYIFMYILLFAMVLQMELYRSEMGSITETNKK